MSLLFLFTNYTAEFGLSAVKDNEGAQANVIVKASGALTQPVTLTFVGPGREDQRIVMPAPTIDPTTGLPT
jgi:hypothetical protein